MARVSGGSANTVVRRRHKATERDNGDMGSPEGEVKDVETYQGRDSETGHVDMAGAKTAVGEEAMKKKKGGTRLIVVCFVGIFVSYFIYGLVQEKM